MTGAYAIRVDGKREVAKYDFQTGCIRCPVCGELVPIGIDNKESEISCRAHEKICNGLEEVDFWRNGV